MVLLDPQLYFSVHLARFQYSDKNKLLFEALFQNEWHLIQDLKDYIFYVKRK